MSNRSNWLTKNDSANSHHGKKYNNIMLFCLVLGEEFNERFEITINTKKTVSAVRDFIKGKKENKLKGIDANNLTLWKVEIPTRNKNDKRAILLKSKPHDQIDVEEDLEGKLLEADDNIDDLFDQQPDTKQINIIVQLPPSATTGKRKVEDSDLDEENISQNSKKEKLIDPTPESIVEFITKQEGVKTDFSKPYILCSNKCNFERKGREESFYKAYDSMLKQYLDIQLALDEKKGLTDKRFFPLFAIQSAPGGGKSFFFDELASFKNEDFDCYLQKKPDDKNAELFINGLRNSVPICITFNGNSPYNPNSDGDGDEIGLGLTMRIIWSYFFDGTELPWNSFYDKFKRNFVSLNTLMAIKSIIYHSGKSVLLCVDEVMKIDNENHTNILKLLASLYTPYQDLAAKDKGFRFIISTLDAARLWNTQTSSGRDIDWIPLRRLELSESIELFSKITEKLRLGRVYIINKCISDCNGHPRTLERFYELLNGNNTAMETNNFATLIEELTKKIGHWFGNITFPVVKLALLGKHVNLEQTVEVNNKCLSVKDLITLGIYINSVTEDANTTKVIPTLTLVSLYYFCMENMENGEHNIKTVAEILKNIIHTEDYFDFKSNDGKAFEEFHMNWELLYRELHEDGMEIDLPKIYGLYDKRVKIKIQRKNIIKLQRDIEFPPNDKIRDIKDTIIEDIEDLEKNIFIPTKSNNRGFEMVIFERKAEGGYIAINIECKFSWPDSETKLSSKEIRNKYESMKTKYLNHVKSECSMVTRCKSSEVKLIDSKTCIGKLGMTIDDIYLIIVAWRDISKLDKDIIDNKNIIIVEKKNLETIYSPSLVSRPQFYSEIQKKIEN